MSTRVFGQRSRRRRQYLCRCPTGFRRRRVRRRICRGNDDQQQLGVVGADCNTSCAASSTALDVLEGIEFQHIAPGEFHGIAVDTNGKFWGLGDRGLIREGIRAGRNEWRERPVAVNGFQNRTVAAVFAERGGDSPRSTIVTIPD